LTSLTLGLAIVFSLEGSSTAKTAQNTLSPAADLALGAIALVVAFVLATGRDGRVRERRSRRTKSAKGPPRWQRTLSKGSPRVTFVVGALLTLPGASYLAGLHNLSKLKLSTATTVLVVIGFNLVMLVLLEAPLLSFAFAPERTPGAIKRGKAWVGRRWRQLAVRGSGLLGAAMIVKGFVGLLA
jgi:hypothetical protein